ncbi:hypothetical protein HBJ58_10890 [Halomonas desiderata]|uniref:hypothetical protein n=1 Tax=Billgrantia desiderata TaxID=52021 RepID=UPI00174DC522|nr:hypothetical protein [Halomonas desiderata]
MPSSTAPTIDIKALARDIRKQAMLLSSEIMQARRQGAGSEATKHLEEAGGELQRMAEELEAWRLQAAELLRRQALTSALKNYALGNLHRSINVRGETLSESDRKMIRQLVEEALDLPDEMKHIAQQLDPREPEQQALTFEPSGELERLREITRDIDEEIEAREERGETVPQSLLDQQERYHHELDQLEAEETRRHGGYTVVLRTATDEGHEYLEEKMMSARDPEAAELEARQWASVLGSVMGFVVEVAEIKGPIAS